MATSILVRDPAWKHPHSPQPGSRLRCRRAPGGLGKGGGTEPLLNIPSCSQPQVTSGGCCTSQNFCSQGEAAPRHSLSETSDLRAFCCAVVGEARDSAAKSSALTHLINGACCNPVPKIETSSPLIPPKGGSELADGLPHPSQFCPFPPSSAIHASCRLPITIFFLYHSAVFYASHFFFSLVLIRERGRTSYLSPLLAKRNCSPPAMSQGHPGHRTRSMD